MINRQVSTCNFNHLDPLGSAVKAYLLSKIGSNEFQFVLVKNAFVKKQRFTKVKQGSKISIFH